MDGTSYRAALLNRDHVDTAFTPFRRYEEALARTHELIERSPAPLSTSQEEIRQRAMFRMNRLRSFLAYLGDPLDRYPIVHVGGTSGKGSTSTAIAALLTAAGYRTGLHTSPYLQVATEKLQIDGRLIAGDRFGDLVDDTLAAAQQWTAKTGESITYGELWIALVAAYFAEEQVDIAVIEVGAGGRFDLTNVVRPVLSVITSISLDHTATLGPTIADIAWHKAGIIKPNAPIVTAVRQEEALAPIIAEAEKCQVPMIRVVEDETYEVIAETTKGVCWRDLATNGDQYVTPMLGSFQAGNAATAIAAIRSLKTLGFDVPQSVWQRGLDIARIPGRCEIVQYEPRVVLDGAHNPEKMTALTSELDQIAARPPGGRLIGLLGMLESKAYNEMIPALVPLFDDVVVTSPQVLAKPAAAVDELVRLVEDTKFCGTILAVEDPAEALISALSLARVDHGDVVVGTGSLYLIGNLRNHWYPDEQIVLQCTPWPNMQPETVD